MGILAGSRLVGRVVLPWVSLVLAQSLFRLKIQDAGGGRYELHVAFEFIDGLSNACSNSVLPSHRQPNSPYCGLSAQSWTINCPSVHILSMSDENVLVGK